MAKPTKHHPGNGVFPSDETPMEWRTKDEHFYLYPRNGFIAVHMLGVSEDGRSVVIGRRKFRLNRDMLKKRPDLLAALVATLTNWRDSL